MIVDALQDSHGPSNPSRRCHGLLHCERCATDLRVKIVEADALRVGIVVSLWHCLGGRDLGQRLPSEESLFDWRRLYVSDLLSPFETSSLPSRNLEQVYDAESEELCSASMSSGVRHSWLQQWTWIYDPWTHNTRTCVTPRD